MRKNLLCLMISALSFTFVAYGMDMDQRCPICQEIIEAATHQNPAATVLSSQAFACNHTTRCHTLCIVHLLRSNPHARCPRCQAERLENVHIVPEPVLAAASDQHYAPIPSVFGRDIPVFGGRNTREWFTRRLALALQQNQNVSDTVKHDPQR